MFPVGDKYVVSSQPFASSPRSLNGTGYGTLNVRNLKVNAARSKWKRMRFPSSIVASASTFRLPTDSENLTTLTTLGSSVPR
uniref:Uncharacterized protein n=1 Tax=Arundo donax TaxID=35708 RepID=A0A0A9H960_ARUDO